MDEFSELEFDLSKPIDELTNAYHRQQAIDLDRSHGSSSVSFFRASLRINRS